eukprot:747668-Hanusia_phi.AAC.1
MPLRHQVCYVPPKDAAASHPLSVPSSASSPFALLHSCAKFFPRTGMIYQPGTPPHPSLHNAQTLPVPFTSPSFTPGLQYKWHSVVP